MGWECSSVTWHFSRMHEALQSTPNTHLPQIREMRCAEEMAQQFKACTVLAEDMS